MPAIWPDGASSFTQSRSRGARLSQQPQLCAALNCSLHHGRQGENRLEPTLAFRVDVLGVSVCAMFITGTVGYLPTVHLIPRISDPNQAFRAPELHASAGLLLSQ